MLLQAILLAKQLTFNADQFVSSTANSYCRTVC